MVSSKRLRNELILLRWYELLCAYAQMYNNINAYLDDCKSSMIILAMHKIQFVILTFRTSRSHYRFFNSITCSCTNYQGIICSRCNAWKGLYSRVGEPTMPRSLWLIISQTLLFELNIILTSVFNFIILLSYHAIRVFLLKNFVVP